MSQTPGFAKRVGKPSRPFIKGKFGKFGGISIGKGDADKDAVHGLGGRTGCFYTLAKVENRHQKRHPRNVDGA